MTLALLLALAVPIPTTAELTGKIANGETLEARIDGDLDGDGRADTVLIGSGEDRRTIYVIVNGRIVGSGPLNAEPGNRPELAIKRGILTFSSQTGGTTQWVMTYRLRWEAAVRRMRLIGLDTAIYSRNFQHDMTETSWNLLTGTQTRQNSKVDPWEGSYIPQRTVTSKRRSKPVYIDALPDPSDDI